MTVGSKQYFSESTNGLAIEVGTSPILLHTFANDSPYELFLYASSESDQTVTLVNGDTSITLDTTAFSDNPLFYGQLISQGTTAFNPNADSDVLSIAVQSDGKILIGGFFSTVGGVTRNSIARLNSDGTLDTGFDPNPNNFGTVHSIAVQSDGKILIGGDFDAVGGVTRNSVARVNTDGTLDTGFDPSVTEMFFATVRSIAVQSDGKILVGGDFDDVGGVTRNRIARVNADGTLDTSFDPNANSTVRSIAVQSDGKIIIGGNFTTIGGVTRNSIARLNADGTLDTGFNPNANSNVRSIAVQSDGKILIGGFFDAVGGVTRNGIARVNADGTLDTGFNPNPNAFGNVRSIAVQSDGKILIGGDFTTVGGVTRNNIALVNADGTLDTGFDPNADSVVLSIAVQSDGKILIGGFFSTVGGVTRNSITRLNADGTLGSTIDNEIIVTSTGQTFIRGYLKEHTQ